jgi:hypothetical protein
MDNIVKANIKFEPKKFNLLINVIIIIGLAIFVSSVIPVSKDIESGSWGGTVYFRNIYGEYIKYECYYDEDFTYLEKKDYEFWYYPSFWIGFGVSLASILTKVIVLACCNSTAEKCYLMLDTKGINGLRKKVFSQKKLVLPMDKIDSIVVKDGISDKLLGGQTVAIYSASGLIKFAWIQNAQEFVDKTLAEIQKYNETIELKNNVTVNIEAEKLQKLKILLEQGLITQEEYDTKRKEMISNI